MATVDLVVSYLSLIDIADSRVAIGEMARVVRPGGHVLIGNLNSWVTAAQIKCRGIVRTAQGHGNMTIANYLTEHWSWAEWRGVRIKNWHRPVSQYMREALQAGLQLIDFQEPVADARRARSESYNHARIFGCSFGVSRDNRTSDLVCSRGILPSTVVIILWKTASASSRILALAKACDLLALVRGSCSMAVSRLEVTWNRSKSDFHTDQRLVFLVVINLK